MRKVKWPFLALLLAACQPANIDQAGSEPEPVMPPPETRSQSPRGEANTPDQAETEKPAPDQTAAELIDPAPPPPPPATAHDRFADALVGHVIEIRRDSFPCSEHRSEEASETVSCRKDEFTLPQPIPNSGAMAVPLTRQDGRVFLVQRSVVQILGVPCEAIGAGLTTSHPINGIPANCGETRQP